MKEFHHTVQDPNGLHARPAGLLVREAQAFSCDITLLCGEKSANLKKILAIMGLGIRQGDTVTVRADGSDEQEAIATLRSAFEKQI